MTIFPAAPLASFGREKFIKEMDDLVRFGSLRDGGGFCGTNASENKMEMMVILASAYLRWKLGKTHSAGMYAE